MNRLSLAGLVATALSAHAQSPAPTLAFQNLESVVVTATRLAQPVTETLRDVTVIPRERIAEAGPVTLAELLQRQALVEFRGTGGAGQPAGLFLRGANAAQTLVLVDGLRVGSATVGTTSIENIPLDLIERIEVVKGPLSSLYGADAVGGVVHVFTRAGARPRLFASAAFGNDGERRAAAGFTAIEGSVTTSVSAGYREAEPASATNGRAFCHDPDRDPYENAFANAQLAWRYWQGESVTIGAFTSRGKARFDGCPDASGRFGTDRNTQTLSGARVSSSLFYAPWWSSRLTVGHGRDELRIDGFEPARFETRQDQAAWIHEFGTRVGTMLLGFETVRQRVLSDTAFTRTKRDTDSVFAGINESWQGQRLEASVRRDEDEQFGGRTTGSASWGFPWPGLGIVALTMGRGYRAPTFFDLYAPSSDFYVPNADLRPERSESREITVKPAAGSAWRIAAYDHRIEDLITYVFPTMQNVRRARIRGVEAAAEREWAGITVRASLAVQRPRDEETGKRLQGRAERFGRLEAAWQRGPWRVSAGVTASGDRYDSASEAEGTRLGGYGLVDATVRYAIDRRWTVELTGSNLGDKRYEHATGYDAPRRSVLLSLRFEAA